MSFGFIEIFFQVEVMHDKLVGVGQERYLPKKGKRNTRKKHEENPTELETLLNQ